MNYRGMLRRVQSWLEVVDSPAVREKLLELDEVLRREVSMAEARRYRRLWWWLLGNRWV